MFLDLISSVMRGFNSVAQDKIEIDELGSGSGDDGSGSGNEDFFDYEQGSTAGVNEEEEGISMKSIFNYHILKIVLLSRWIAVLHFNFNQTSSWSE